MIAVDCVTRNYAKASFKAKLSFRYQKCGEERHFVEKLSGKIILARLEPNPENKNLVRRECASDFYSQGIVICSEQLALI